MSTISITDLYEHLDVTLGKDTAKKLTTLIGGQIDDKFANNMKTLATKEDLSNLEVKLENKINAFKVDIIKWIFAFWITVILMFIGLYFKP